MTNEDAKRILLNSNEYHHARGDLPHSAASIEAFNKAVDALYFKGEVIRMVDIGISPEAIVEWVRERATG